MRRWTAPSVIGWTLASVVVPGIVHLRAGRKRTGMIMMGIFGVLLIGAVIALINRNALAGLLLDPTWLAVLTGLCVAAGLAWAGVVISSYIVLRPARLGKWGQLGTATVAGVLAVTVALPFGLAATTARTSDDAIGSVFKSSPSKPIDHRNPWQGRDRLNIALLGGDGAASRKGVSIRTDSINVVSIDVRTGNSVVLALPREMENAPFAPGSALARRFPPPKNFYLPPAQGRGSADLLNAVWAYADTHPEVAGHSPERAPEAVKGTLGQILGLKIDYYMLVNMWGVARLIDALGGVTINVEQDVCYGVGRSDGGVVKAGTRTLDGNEALWYGRARDHPGSTCAGADNHTRMLRQQCVMSAMLNQLNPGNVLLKFNALAKAAKETFRTDIPRDLLQDLVPLAQQVKGAKVAKMNFVPPAYNPAYPDYPRIRKAVRAAIARSGKVVRAQAATPSPTSTPTTTRSPRRIAQQSDRLDTLDSACAPAKKKT
ncbi:LCP family glycopolymer transferase [Nonomuraea aurantiaca]|uniref:LCP family glycopolymer transferase n=1 Tax=Nonomuraea aurantiaca TaxID=2878562 RepID=UPI001CDA3F70|nr:LCP family protein [Nonomuraea aurantiaca]MCA2223329.1 LCP family protein [Nonomuraea aurantiaca]